MIYQKKILLKNGQECVLRNGEFADGEEVLKVFLLTHEETDYLLTYNDEKSLSAKEEGEFLQKQTDSERNIELVAEVEGKIVGLAGFEEVGGKEKVRHRAEFGISVLNEFWGMGIGSALMDSCVDLARKVGYRQMELSVVAENERAVRLYEKAGFVVFGRNPLGFISRFSGAQEVLLMRKEL